MNRRKFLRIGAAISSLAPLASGPLANLFTMTSSQAASPPRVTSRQVPSGNIRDYLSREAQRITDHNHDTVKTALAEFNFRAGKGGCPAKKPMNVLDARPRKRRIGSK